MRKAKKQTFMEAGLHSIKRLRTRKTGYTGEDIKMKLMNQGIKPNHNNAWGSLIRTAANQDLIIATGETRKVKNPDYNGRQTPIYMINR